MAAQAHSSIHGQSYSKPISASTTPGLSLCLDTVGIFYCFLYYFSHVTDIPSNNLFPSLFSGYFIAIASCIQNSLKSEEQLFHPS